MDALHNDPLRYDLAAGCARSVPTAYRRAGGNILAAIQRDPGGRVLVVIQCQWHDTLEPLLKEKARGWMQIADYRKL